MNSHTEMMEAGLSQCSSNVADSSFSIRNLVAGADNLISCMQDNQNNSDASRYNAHYMQLDVSLLLNAVITMLRPRIPAHCEVILRCDQLLPRYFGCAHSIASAFYCLLSNAADSCVLSGDVEILVMAVEGGICISISDSGAGYTSNVLQTPDISKDGIDALLNIINSSKISSRLSLASRLITQQNGKLDVISESDIGTVAIVYLKSSDQ